MSTQAPVLMIIAPLIASIFITLIGWFRPKLSHPIAVISLLISSIASIQVFQMVLSNGPQQYFLGNWPAPFGIEYVIDHLNSLLLVTISVVATLVALYAKRSVEKELPDKLANYYTLFVLLVTGLLGISITGDAFNLYVLLEIAALTSYALIAFAKGRSLMATFNYVMMGSIGACFYLLGVGYLFIKTGTLNMTNLSQILVSLHMSQAVLVGFVLIILGMWVKMAFFPVHGWLSNAYTYAPTASTCLIAPLMTKVSVYVMIRVMTSVFSTEYVFNHLSWHLVVVAMASVAILVGSMMALSQRDLKKCMTYLVVAEIGYMVGGAWLGNPAGMTGATYHIIADAAMTACLFMAVGCIIYKHGHTSLDTMKGIFRKMPLTMLGFVVGMLSMIGVPPTCGFFSKWYLISGAIEAGQWHFMLALLFSSLVNAIIFFRIIEIGFFGSLGSETPDPHEHQDVAVKEAPLSMVLPMLVVAGALIGIGIYTSDIISLVIQPLISATF